MTSMSELQKRILIALCLGTAVLLGMMLPAPARTFVIAGEPAPQPVYRFWNAKAGTHFYTISASERDKLKTRHADTWTFEGVAWYAFVAPTEAQ